MKKNIMTLLCAGILATSLHATVYEDAEDGLVSRWNLSAGATATNLTDAERNSKVISLDGGSYTIGDLKQGVWSWNNRTEKNLQLSIKTTDYFFMYVSITTDKGDKFLVYEPRDGNFGDKGNGYIYFGVGKDSNKGTWVDIIRDLEKDLKTFDPDNNIVAINGVKILGNVVVDDLSLQKDKPLYDELLYEDAEDGDTIGWQVYDKSPLGATIENVFDAEKNSRVIKLTGSGMENGYIVGNWDGRPNAWSELNRKTLTWEMKFSESYGFFVTVETTKGHRYLYYDATNTNRGLLYNEYIHHGISTGYMDGKWHTVTVDLEADLQEYEPDNSIVRITGFLIRGSGLIDNIRFTDGPPVLAPTVYESVDNGVISDGWTTVLGGTPVASGEHQGHTYVRLQEHWQKNDDGTWTNPAEYHLEMHNRTQKILSVDVGGSGEYIPHYVMGARVTTREKGVRTLLWSSFYLHDNIEPTNRDGFMIFPCPVEQVRGWFDIPVDQWENFSINLEDALQIWEPTNTIVSVDYFISTGGVLDNITLK
jgi:hypothetical protein